MVSLDLSSLFKNVPLDQVTNIPNDFYKNNDKTDFGQDRNFVIESEISKTPREPVLVLDGSYAHLQTKDRMSHCEGLERNGGGKSEDA